MAFGEVPLPLALGYEEVVRREQASLFLAEKLPQAGEEVAESWEMRNTKLSNPSVVQPPCVLSCGWSLSGNF